jgi:hypothetical protein
VTTEPTPAPTPPAAGPPHPSWHPAPQHPATNGFAIASLVLGLIGGVLLSVVFGILALTQVKKRGQKGKGLAIAGLALSGVWTLVLAGLAVLLLAFNHPQPSEQEKLEASLYTWDVGDCVLNYGTAESLNLVPDFLCNSPHDGEIVGELLLPGGEYPSEDDILALAEEECWTIAEDYMSDTYFNDDTLTMAFQYPAPRGWQTGDRSLYCVVLGTDRNLKGSMRKTI